MTRLLTWILFAALGLVVAHGALSGGLRRPVLRGLTSPARGPSPIHHSPVTSHYSPLTTHEVTATVGGRAAPDGTELQVDLPGDQHMENAGGSDGSGLCVFTSIAHAARWQNVGVLEDFRDWMRKHPGGGYPAKVERMIAQICKERGVTAPAYIQVEGKDLDILKLACRSGRMPSVTYCWSPSGRYGGGRIAHMVSLVHADDKWFCVLDNNHPGEGKYEWMSEAEFRKTYTGMGGGWSVILLDAGPPPPPCR